MICFIHVGCENVFGLNFDGNALLTQFLGIHKAKRSFCATHVELGFTATDILTKACFKRQGKKSVQLLNMFSTLVLMDCRKSLSLTHSYFYHILVNGMVPFPGLYVNPLNLILSQILLPVSTIRGQFRVQYAPIPSKSWFQVPCNSGSFDKVASRAKAYTIFQVHLAVY